MFKRFTCPEILRAADDAGAGAGGATGAAGADGTAAVAAADEGAGATGAAGAAGAQAASGAGGAGAAAGGVPDWQASLSEGVRAALAPKGFKSPEDMGQAYIELESLSGRRGVPLPGDKATEEEWQDFYKKIPGYPATPDKYDLSAFKVPEGLPWNAEAQAEILPALHKRGLTQAQLVGVMQDYAEVQNKYFTAMNADAAKFAKSTLDGLKKEWGPQAEAKLASADREARYFLDKDLEAARQLRLADGTYMLDHPFLARAFARVGDEFGEDTIATRKRPVGGGGASPESAKAEIATLEKNPDTSKALMDANHPEHKAVVERRSRLYQIAYPERPAP